MSRETMAPLSVKVSFGPQEGKPATKQDKRKIDPTVSLEAFFFDMCNFFQIPDVDQPLYCLCISDSNVVVTSFKTLGKYFSSFLHNCL